MNNPIDYSKYKISFTSDFEKVWLQLKNGRDAKSREIVNKVYEIIDAVLSGEDVETKYHAHHPRKDTDVWDIHIEPQGRTTGNLVLLYRINNFNIELDLRLQNIVKHDHGELHKKSDTKYADRQPLYNFDIITNKYSKEQIDYGRACYNHILSDYQLFKYEGENRKNLTNKHIDEYIELYSLPDITRSQLIEILYYIEAERKKHIFGSIQFDNSPKETGKITSQEEYQIMSIFDSLAVNVVNAYIDTITDEYGDTYEDMYVVSEINDVNILNTLISKLNRFSQISDIQFTYSPNGYAKWGQTFDFYHYFEE